MKLDKKDLLLYAITDRQWLKEKRLSDVVEESLQGGVSCVQLREKKLNELEFLEEALQIAKLCEKYKVPFIVNDNVEIAIRSNAKGVHVGQEDMRANKVRDMIGTDKILGVSVQTVEQAILAEKEGADYLGVGAMFPTNTKKDADKVELSVLKNICKTANIPVVAIGGITCDNIEKFADTGICGVSVISAIYGSTNIEKATRDLKLKLEKTLKI